MLPKDGSSCFVEELVILTNVTNLPLKRESSQVFGPGGNWFGNGYGQINVITFLEKQI